MPSSAAARPVSRADTSARAASLAEAYRFFVPLIAMVGMQMLAQSIIHAVLARGADAEAALAAYALGFSLHNPLGSPMWASQYLALAAIRDRPSVRRLLLFNLKLLAPVTALSWLVAFTPAGDFLFGTLLGASPRWPARRATSPSSCTGRCRRSCCARWPWPS